MPSDVAKIVIAYRGETKRVDFYSEGCNVLLLELASDVAFDECGLEPVVSILSSS
jgi:hypothetical protein